MELQDLEAQEHLPHELHEHIQDEMGSLEKSLDSFRKSSYNMNFGNETSRTSGVGLNSLMNTPNYN